MKTKLTGLLLTALATTLFAQAPPAIPPPAATPPGPTGKSKAINVEVRPLNPQAPANVSAVQTNAPGTPRVVPNSTAPEPFRQTAPLGGPTANLIAPAAPSWLTIPH